MRPVLRLKYSFLRKTEAFAALLDPLAYSLIYHDNYHALFCIVHSNYMDKRHSYTETLIHSQCISDIVLAKFVKESQKKSLSRHPQGHRPRLFAFDRKSTFILTFGALRTSTGKHTGLRFISAQRAGNQRFSTFIPTDFGFVLSAWKSNADRR